VHVKIGIDGAKESDLKSVAYLHRKES